MGPSTAHGQATPPATLPPATATPDPPPSSGELWATIVSGGDEPSVAISYEELVAHAEPTAVAPVVARRRCEVWEAPGGPGSQRSENLPFGAVAGALVEGAWYYQTCSYVETGDLASSRYFQHAPGQPGFGVDLAALALSALDAIALPYPVPHTSPALDRPQITGLPTWLWIDPGQWQPLTADAALAGYRVTVTATPRSITWDMGEAASPHPHKVPERHQVTCHGPGRPYDLDGPDSQHSDCTYAYRWVSGNEPDGRYHATTTMAWDIAWHASTGESGTLAPASRTTRFALTVDEIEAVICYQPRADDCEPPEAQA